MARVVRSHPAREQLIVIRRYIARIDSSGAERVVGRLLSASRRLETFPESGRIVPEYQRQEFREIIVNPYRLVYHIDPATETVEIVSVWRGARLLGDFPT